ncbi:MAG: SPW repeat protein [Kiloniellaceae bacterium]
MASFWKTVANRWQDSTNLVLGVWLFVSPWVLQFIANERAMWNAFVLGVIIAVAAIAALVAFHEWEEWADMAFGVWLIISPWVLGFGTTMVGAEAGAFAATWNFVVVGVLTIALAAWSLRGGRQREARAT